jgi:protocatechuate 3,4-dioxygenase beta subunit
MILTLVLLWSLATAQEPSPPAANDLGTIKGTVVDPSGKPVEGARVYVAGDNDPPMSRPDATTTNANGEFVLDHVLPRKVKIHAYKDGDYYADVKFAFNISPNWVMPEVEVKPGQTVTGVAVRLAQKAAKLHLYVRDATTKDLVHGIYFQLCREDHPTYCLAGSGPPDFERLVPV